MLVVKNKRFPQTWNNRGWNTPGVFDQFFNREFHPLFGNELQSTLPHVNILEDETGFHIELAAPGLAKEDLKIDLDKQVLTVSAEKKATAEDKKPNYLKREFSYQTFKRSFNVPENVDTTGVKASFENGVLKVVLPKKEKDNTVTSKTITIG